MKKSLRVILTITLTLLVLSLIESFGMKNLVVKTISNEFTSKKISGYVLDVFVFDSDMDTLEEIGNKVKKSKYIDKITLKYLNVISKNLVEDGYTTFEIKEELENIVNKDLKELSSDKKAEVLDKLTNSNLDSIEYKLEDILPTNYNPLVMVIIKAFYVFTSIWFRVIAFVLTIINILLLFAFNKEKIATLKNISVGLIVIWIILTIQIILTKVFSYKLTNKIIGRSADLNQNMLIVFAGISIIVAVILIIIKKLKKTQNN